MISNCNHLRLLIMRLCSFWVLHTFMGHDALGTWALRSRFVSMSPAAVLNGIAAAGRRDDSALFELIEEPAQARIALRCCYARHQ